MEIPNANIYNSVEKIRKVDFLDRDIKLSFSIDGEVAEHLPEISDEELETGQEKYHVLLGRYEQISDNEINVRIKGILMADPAEEKDLFYQEKKEEVNPNLVAIKKWVSAIQSTSPEYENFNFIGDIHTHPITKNNKLNKDIPASNFSDSDIEDIINEYENGTLSADEPFIFGIAGRRHGDDSTEYAFYRIVKEKDSYKVEPLEKK